MSEIIDFTIRDYAELLDLARARYRFAGYGEAAHEVPTVLWRHDCDVSLNRALRLARLEHDRGVRATYFINPHAEFYNLLEKSQAAVVHEIVGLGHEIGLHFDAAFHDLRSEHELAGRVRMEARWLREWFGTEIAAFSFHNPTSFLLTCEAEEYGGLINCYSAAIKSSFTYCSDSNGYWRFRRLHDLLSEEPVPRLQVLTHPEWWQEEQLPPRSRIFRSVYGRARATLALYDQTLTASGRRNEAGAANNLDFLRELDQELYEASVYLWESRRWSTLFLELWSQHERQVEGLCAAWYRQVCGAPIGEIEELMERRRGMEACALFEQTFGEHASAGGISVPEHLEWTIVRDRLLAGGRGVSDEQSRAGCIYLCGAIRQMADWGRSQIELAWDGISGDGPHFASAGAAEANGRAHSCDEPK